VERLASDLLPALIARLTASGLAELEVREGPWKVRLRRPLEIVGAGRGAVERHQRLSVGTSAGSPVAAAARHAGLAMPGLTGSTAEGRAGRAEGRSEARGEGQTDQLAGTPTVSSPAVGIFRPRAGIRGTTVREGDRLGVVDMLGIAQDVLAPSDGVVGEILAAPGDGVEYGQVLFTMAAIRGPADAEAAPVGSEDQLAAPAGDRR
jgi:biotin carboxyl carrier protein